MSQELFLNHFSPCRILLHLFFEWSRFIPGVYVFFGSLAKLITTKQFLRGFFCGRGWGELT